MPNRHKKARDEELIAHQRQLLVRVIKMGEWTGTELARAAALAPSTVNKFVKGEVVHALSSKTVNSIMSATLQRLEHLTNQAVSEEEKGKIRRKILTLTTLQTTPIAKSIGGQGVNKSASRPVQQVWVVGAVQGGEWAEAIRWEDSDHYMIDAPKSRKYPGARREALVVRGPSMNLLYPEGTVVLTVSPQEMDLEPRPGQKVVVERLRKDGLREATIKVYQPDEQGRIWLWPKSNHPDFQQPIELKPAGDIEEVKIIGLVVGVYRDED